MKRYIGFLFLIVGLLTFQSCLYDEPVEKGKYGMLPENLETKKIIEFKGMYDNLGATNIRLDQISVLRDQPTKKVTLGTVHLSASTVAEQDITVNVTLSHNNVEGDKFPLEGIKLLPTVIKAGESDALIEAELTTDYVTGAGSSVRMDLSVAQSGYIVSGNFGQMILTIKERSKYEGSYVYQMVSQNAWSFDLASSVANGETLYMSTITTNSVIFNPAYGYWSDQVILTFDPETDKVVAADWVGWDVWSLVEGESSYDPATKTYVVSMTAGGKSRLVIKLTRQS